MKSIPARALAWTLAGTLSAQSIAIVLAQQNPGKSGASTPRVTPLERPAITQAPPPGDKVLPKGVPTGLDPAAKRALLQRTVPGIPIPGVFETLRLTPETPFIRGRARLGFWYPTQVSWGERGGIVEFIGAPLLSQDLVNPSHRAVEHQGSAGVTFETVAGRSYLVSFGLAWAAGSNVTQFVLRSSGTPAVTQTVEFRDPSAIRNYWEGNGTATIHVPASSRPGKHSVNISSTVADKRWYFAWVEVDPL